MTADLTPARCGATAVHPPHPIDGATPGVADCDGLERRATDTEIAQAKAYVKEHCPDWPEAEADRVHAQALEVLIHANGGRYAEPTVAGPGRAERTAIAARNIEQRLEDAGGYRAWLNDEAWAELVATAAEAAATVYEPMLAAYDAEIATPDRLVTAVLDAATAWRRGIGNFRPEGLFDPMERAMASAVDAMLAARSSNGEDQESGALSPRSAERAEAVPESTPDGSGGSQSPAATDLATLLERGESACLEHRAVWPDCAAQHEPVTPAADLADEAAHERVADALRDALGTPGVLNPGREAAERSVAYNLAKVAIDAYHAGQPTRSEALNAIGHLTASLHRRGLLDDTQPATAARTVATALEEITAQAEAIAGYRQHIDQLTTALGDAARDQLDDLEPDGGLSTDQEIRLAALIAAVHFDSLTSEQVAQNAARFEAYIRNGAPIVLTAPTTRSVLDGDGALNTTTDGSQP